MCVQQWWCSQIWSCSLTTSDNIKYLNTLEIWCYIYYKTQQVSLKEMVSFLRYFLKWTQQWYLKIGQSALSQAHKVYDYKRKTILEIQIGILFHSFSKHWAHITIRKNGHSSYLHGPYYVEGSLILNKWANIHNMQM